MVAGIRHCCSVSHRHCWTTAAAAAAAAAVRVILYGAGTRQRSVRRLHRQCALTAAAAAGGQLAAAGWPGAAATSAGATTAGAAATAGRAATTDRTAAAAEPVAEPAQSAAAATEWPCQRPTALAAASPTAAQPASGFRPCGQRSATDPDQPAVLRVAERVATAAAAPAGAHRVAHAADRNARTAAEQQHVLVDRPGAVSQPAAVAAAAERPVSVAEPAAMGLKCRRACFRFRCTASNISYTYQIFTHTHTYLPILTISHIFVLKLFLSV